MPEGAERGQVVHRPSLDSCAVRDLEKNGMVRAGRGWASVNQRGPNCVNQMGKTYSKPLPARHGRGTAGRGMLCVNRL